jgi:hypothetical protein
MMMHAKHKIESNNDYSYENCEEINKNVNDSYYIKEGEPKNEDDVWTPICMDGKCIISLFNDFELIPHLTVGIW